MSSKSDRNFFEQCSNFLAKKKAIGDFETKEPAVDLREKAQYACDICQKAFARNQNLTKHMATHSLLRPFICPVCESCFKHKDNLRQHLKTHVLPAKYSCPFCPKNFCNEGNFKAHELVHAEKQKSARKHICNICKKAFKSEKGLVVHSVVHSGSKSFTCSHCSHSYSSKDSLGKHVLRYHKAIKEEMLMEES